MNIDKNRILQTEHCNSPVLLGSFRHAKRQRVGNIPPGLGIWSYISPLLKKTHTFSGFQNPGSFNNYQLYQLTIEILVSKWCCKVKSIAKPLRQDKNSTTEMNEKKKPSRRYLQSQKANYRISIHI